MTLNEAILALKPYTRKFLSTALKDGGFPLQALRTVGSTARGNFDIPGTLEEAREGNCGFDDNVRIAFLIRESTPPKEPKDRKRRSHVAVHKYLLQEFTQYSITAFDFFDRKAWNDTNIEGEELPGLTARLTLVLPDTFLDGTGLSLLAAEKFGFLVDEIDDFFETKTIYQFYPDNIGIPPKTETQPEQEEERKSFDASPTLVELESDDTPLTSEDFINEAEEEAGTTV